MIELKPCPFCGSKWLATRQQPWITDNYVVCLSCGARGPVRATADAAQRVWNRRAETVRHGHWMLKAEPPEYDYVTIVCSCCKEEFVVEANNEPLMPYCAECGAKMDVPGICVGDMDEEEE